MEVSLKALETKFTLAASSAAWGWQKPQVVYLLPEVLAFREPIKIHPMNNETVVVARSLTGLLPKQADGLFAILFHAVPFPGPEGASY